jgi:AcrR family transcriptional regulator
VVARAGVAKATLYHHFPSKNDLIIAFLQEREDRWTFGWVVAEAERRADDPEGQLLAIFDLFDEWFQRDDYEGCSFLNVLVELGRDHPAGRASVGHMATIKGLLSSLADWAGLRDPDAFAESCHLIMKGAVVQAAEGDLDAARRARVLARLLITHHREESPL